MFPSVDDGFVSSSRSDASEPARERLEEVLDDPHCRHLLECLREADGPVPEGTLARRVVARITDSPPEDVSDEVQRRVQTWFHHGQLPVLDEYGVVAFDADSGEVSLGRDESAR